MDEIVLPSAPPADILRMLDFYRAHREAAEPLLPEPVTPAVSAAATEIWERVSVQAHTALEAGTPEVAARIPKTPEIAAALKWRVDSEELFDEIMIGGHMVSAWQGDWERDYALFKYFMHVAAEQASADTN